MASRLAVVVFGMLVSALVPTPAAGQLLLQDFEQGLLYEQCFAGDNVSLSWAQPMQGQRQLATGPLNKNKSATYLTPFLQMRANGFVRFKHRNESPSAGNPTTFVDLLDATGGLVATIYTFTYGSDSLPIVAQPQVPADGLYRVRFRFEGDRGSERVGLDELNIDGSLATTGPPCQPIIPGQPPSAVPDSASSQAAYPVTVNVLANDVAGASPIAPDTVDLTPEDTAVIDRERDIRDQSGVVVGRAVVDTEGNVVVTPSAQAVGSLAVAYSVRDTAGRISNITQLTVTVLAPNADLAVTLNGPAMAEAGTTAIYVATVQNLGPTSSAEAVLTFQIAGPLTDLVAFCPGRAEGCGAAVVSGSTVTMTLSGLATLAVVDVRLLATASAPGTAVVTATIAAVNPSIDLVPGNNTSAVSTAIGPAPGADVGIVMQGPADVFPGASLTYALAVTNNGPEAAASVVVASDGPPGALFVANQGACVTAFPCALGVMASGESRIITSTYSLPLPAGTILPRPPLTNTATVSATTADPNSGNNAANVSSRVKVDLDVALSMTVSAASIPMGQVGSVVLVASNSGPMPARQVPIGVTWPSGLELVSASATSGTVDQASGTWTVPEINPSDQAELTITFRPQTSGQAFVRAMAQVPITDVQASNDAASVLLQGAASADVAVRLSASPLSPALGQSVQILLEAGNLGQSVATGVSVQQVLPAGLRLVSATPSAGVFEPTTGTWTLGAIGPSVIATLTTVAVVEATGVLVIGASGSGAEFDPDTTNNATALALSAAGSADLQISMVTNIGSPVAGDTIDLVGSLSNRGPSLAENVVVTFDLAPPGSITVLSVTPSAGTFQGNQLVIGTLAPGGVVTVTARVLVVAAEPITLGGTASASTFDPLLTNNRAVILMNSGPSVGMVAQDFENRTGNFVCWGSPGFSPGGVTATGLPFGQTALNPPLQLLVHMVSGPLSNPGDHNAIESPWIRFFGVGVITYLTRINNATSGPVQSVSIIDVATQTETVIYSRAYGAADGGETIRDTLPVTFSGIYQIRWRFAGNDGASRVAIDDIVIDGELATEGGADSTRPFDCRPDLPNPPEALPDFASTPPDTPVAIAVLANDSAPQSVLNPASVTLDPLFALDQVVAIDVFRTDGVRLGRATVDATGVVTFASEAGVTGSGTIPYAVKNVAGALSNIALAAVVVGTASTDVATAVIGPANANPGAAVTYSVDLRNVGLDAATGITVTGAATNGLRLVLVACALPNGFSCGSGTVSADGASFTIGLAGLTPQGLAILTIAAMAPGLDTVVTLTATAVLSPPVTDSNPGNNAASVSTTIGTGPVLERADLSIVKTGPVSITAGETAVYVLTVSNAGPRPADAVVVNDPGPPGFSRISVEGDCSAFPCSLGTLSSGATRQVTVRYATANASRSVGGVPVVNRATVASATEDPNLANNVSEVRTSVVIRYDLDISANVATPAVPIGQPAIVTVVVDNHGTSNASGVAVSVPMATGFTFASASPSRGSYDPGTGNWIVGGLAAGEIAELSLTVTVELGTHTLVATITDGLAGDTNSGNDQTSAAVTGLPTADSALSSTVSNDAPLEGELITIVLTASNAGPSDATGIVVAGVVPAGLTLQSATVSSGTVDAATQTWSLPSLPVGTAAQMNLIARADTTGALNPSALIAAQAEVDLNNANNSTGVLINAGPSADIQVDVSVPIPYVAIGETATVLVTVVNTGPSDAANTVVQAQIPAGFSVTAVTPSLGVIDQGRWVVGSLSPGASATLNVNGIITAHGEVSTVVKASSSAFDPEPTNNTASVSINSVGADVRLTMFPGTLSPLISANATMYVRVTNEGPGTALGVSVPITIAPGLARLAELLTQGTFDPGTLTWTVGSLPPHTTAQMALFVRVSDGGILPITGKAVVASGADLLPGNNEAFGVFDVVDPTRTVADMQLMIAGPPSAVPGGLVSFAADAVNNGSTYAVDVTTTVDVPSWASFVSATPTFGGSCTTPAPGSSAGAVTCTWPGQSVVGRGRLRRVDVVLSVAPGIAEGTALALNGSVTSLTLDPFPSNNLAVAHTVANAGGPAADVRLAKFLLADGAVETTVPQGQTAIYRLVVTNAGAEAASGVEILETVLPELPILRGRWSQGTVNESRRLWSVGTLAPGAAATLDVELRAASAGRFVLPATRLASTPVDPNASNDRASIVIDVPPAGWGGRYVATGNVDGLGSSDILVGTGLFEPTQIRIFAGDGSHIASFYPYDPRFAGGVRVASCDIDADGRDEIITGAGPGGGPHIRVVKLFPGDRITEFLSFYADAPDYSGGVYVACGDVTGDGVPEVIVGAGLGAAPELRVWEVGAFSFTEIARMRLDTGMASEVRVAVCDVNGDGRNEVLAASGAGPPAVVAIIDPLTRRAARVIRPLGGYTGGVFVACGDLTGSFAGPEIVVASDAGGPPIVEFYSADGVRLAGVLAEAQSFRGGVRVAVGDVDPTPMSELVAVAGYGGIPRVRLASGATNVLVELRSFVSPNVP
jgi:uncharacterized repeat protein (TIGR01451 family)